MAWPRAAWFDDPKFGTTGDDLPVRYTSKEGVFAIEHGIEIELPGRPPSGPAIAIRLPKA